ncbi:MAG: ABC transporter permease subunit, partial [Clostridiales Family XIII bacterium]|nr:ABC transporter permease subunit [Clostridiales Family XIII bacterium]
MLASVESRRAARVFLCVLSALFALSTAFTKFNPLDALLAQGEFWSFIFTDFIPPRIQRLGALFTAVKQTLYMAIGATGVSSVLSLILGFLGTPAICRRWLVVSSVRGFASLLRNIPVLVWAFILVAAFGIGTAVGVISLVISTVGELTRYFIETLDEVAGENIEALEATGAGMLPVIAQAILPAAMPSFIAWFLYCLEL